MKDRVIRFFEEVEQNYTNNEKVRQLYASLKLAASKERVTPDMLNNKVIGPLRDEFMKPLIKAYLTEHIPMTNSAERADHKDRFYDLARAFGYSQAPFEKMIEEIRASDFSDKGGRTDTAEYPKAVSTTKATYVKYISSISRTLQTVGGKTGQQYFITKNSIAAVLFTPRWVAYYNKNYGLADPRPLIPKLISEDMLTFIHDQLRIPARNFVQLAKDAVTLAIDLGNE